MESPGWFLFVKHPCFGFKAGRSGGGPAGEKAAERVLEEMKELVQEPDGTRQQHEHDGRRQDRVRGGSVRLAAELLKGSGLALMANRAEALVPCEVSATPPARRAAASRQPSGS
jgi:hypothetical protein